MVFFERHVKFKAPNTSVLGAFFMSIDAAVRRLIFLKLIQTYEFVLKNCKTMNRTVPQIGEILRAKNKTNICLGVALTVIVNAMPSHAQEAGDAANGEAVFKKCKACHQVGPEARNRVGPQLNEILGRPAGSLDGFKYSKSMIDAGADGLVWDEATLDAFLEKPKSVVPKTKMSFAGLRKQSDRDDMIAYLKTFSDSEAVQATSSASDMSEIDPDILAIEGDAEFGAYLSTECTTCHQLDGSNTGIPTITHWPIEDFVIAMHAYKNKTRAHPVMQMTAARLSNEEIAALAAYFKDVD